jgi:hypothetical protein
VLVARSFLLGTNRVSFWTHDYQGVPGTLMTGKPGVRKTVDEFCQVCGYAKEKTIGSLALLKKR